MARRATVATSSVEKATCCGRSVGVPGQRSDVEGEPARAGDGADDLAPHQPVGSRNLLAGIGRETEQAAVEQHRLVEALPRHGQVDVVDPGQQGPRALVAALELGDPGGVRRRGDGSEEDLGAVGGAEGREAPARWRGYGGRRSDAWSARARAADAAGSATSNPTAARVGVRSRACCSLHTTRAGPSVHSRASLLRCLPRNVKPSCPRGRRPRRCPRRGPRRSRTPTVRSTAGSGVGGSVRELQADAEATRSSSQVSERRA